MKQYEIICGITGMGKSTTIKNKHNEFIYVSCDAPCFSSSYSILEDAISIKSNSQDVLEAFYNTLLSKNGIIIDNTETIDIDILKVIINMSKKLDKAIIFIFDLSYKELYKNEPFMKLIEWNIVSINDSFTDFKVDRKTIESFLQKEYYEIERSEYDLIIKLTKYNFNNIKKLMWINKTITGDLTKLSNESIEEYKNNEMEVQLSRLEPILSDILKKSSIIGRVFEKKPLESLNGFYILGVDNYLKELEKFGNFISKVFSKDGCYQFITFDVYTGVLSLIHSSQKTKWQKILLEYYIYLYNNSTQENIKIELLTKAKQIAIDLTDELSINRINKVLLHYYLIRNDNKNSIMIISELLNSEETIGSTTYKNYLLLIKLHLLLDIGDYKNALIITQKFAFANNYNGSKEYILYYYIKCLYSIGDIDRANFFIVKLIKTIQNTSRSGNTEQRIYPLAYSMMASIQNHLAIDDRGQRYYYLALNYAFNNNQNKDLYYDILSQCDMFFSKQIALKYLENSAAYFNKNGNKYKAAKVYFNLATEILFNEEDVFDKIKEHFLFAKQVFYLPDEHLAYAKNNYAIYRIMVNNDFYSAIDELEHALFVGLSDFTYMTIYLNLSMSYYHLYGKDDERFINSYKMFQKHENAIEKRQTRTRYEIIYRIITEIVFFGRDDSRINNELEQYWSINSGDTFFKTIIDTIKNRSHVVIQSDSDDSAFFKFIKRTGLFLAEFRFWE